ncbi:MAG: glycosyltransferase family 2 protein [Candidatus Paceibacterota bacterium]
MSYPPKIFVIVLQYNNSRDTIGCLESAKELGYPETHIVVIDNASSIDHVNNIRFFVENQEKKDRITLIENKTNTGYAGGNNTGIRFALKNKADYVLILNPDVRVKPNLLDEMLGAERLSPNVGLVGTGIDEGDRIINCGKIEWLNPELRHEKQEIGNLLDKDCYIPGNTILIKKSVIKKIGMLDEKYFLYFEDADFCQRAKREGFNLVTIQDALVNHSVSSSTSSLGSALLLRYHYRNAHLFNSKNGPWYVKIALPFWSFYIIIKQLAKIVLSPRKRKISKAILAGVTDFYKGRFGKIAA